MFPRASLASGPTAIAIESLVNPGSTGGPTTQNFTSGTFRIADMSGYPASVSARPDGVLRLISGEEYNLARRAANNANAKLRNQWNLTSNQQIHEVIPVNFGGSPTNVANKTVVTKEQHKALNTWWGRIKKAVKD